MTIPEPPFAKAYVPSDAPYPKELPPAPPPEFGTPAPAVTTLLEPKAPLVALFIELVTHVLPPPELINTPALQ